MAGWWEEGRVSGATAAEMTIVAPRAFFSVRFYLSQLPLLCGVWGAY